MEQDLVHDLVAAYALDALDESERREFEEHLAGCERCREELESLRDAAAALAYVPEGPAPPPALRERVLQRVHDEKASNVVPLRRRVALPAVATVAVVAAAAAIVLAVWASSLSSSLDTKNAALAVLSNTASQRTPLGTASEVVVAPDGRAVVVSGLSRAPRGKTLRALGARRQVRPAGRAVQPGRERLASPAGAAGAEGLAGRALAGALGRPQGPPHDDHRSLPAAVSVNLRAFPGGARRTSPRDYSDFPDEALLALAAREDEEALARIYDRYSRVAYGLALRIVRDQALAEDAVQEAFLTVWRTAGSFRADRAKPSTWILTLVHRRAVDVVRREERRRAAPLEGTEEPDERGLAADEEIELTDRRRIVQEALRQLPDEQREALELAYYGGLTQSELAERLSVPLGTIKSRMFTGLRRLRDLLSEAGVDEPLAEL